MYNEHVSVSHILGTSPFLGRWPRQVNCFQNDAPAGTSAHVTCHTLYVVPVCTPYDEVRPSIRPSVLPMSSLWSDRSVGPLLLDVTIIPPSLPPFPPNAHLTGGYAAS